MKLGKVPLPGFQVSPVSIIPPLLHTHPFIYHPRCIMFFSQHFSFPCQYHSTIAPYSFIHLHVALATRTNGRSLGTFQKVKFLPQSRSPCQQSITVSVSISAVQCSMQWTAHIWIVSKRGTTILNSPNMSSLKHQIQFQNYNSLVIEPGVFPLREKKAQLIRQLCSQNRVTEQPKLHSMASANQIQ